MQKTDGKIWTRTIKEFPSRSTERILIGKADGFGYWREKTTFRSVEPICFTNWNSFWKFLTNPWKISLPFAKLWPEKLKNNIGTLRIPFGRADGFSYQKNKQISYILITEVSWSHNAFFWFLKMSNVPKFYNNLVKVEFRSSSDF